jgi:hypothetical protein
MEMGGGILVPPKPPIVRGPRSGALVGDGLGRQPWYQWEEVLGVLGLDGGQELFRSKSAQIASILLIPSISTRERPQDNGEGWREVNPAFGLTSRPTSRLMEVIEKRETNLSVRFQMVAES